jgi:hypothetical protein
MEVYRHAYAPTRLTIKVKDVTGVLYYPNQTCTLVIKLKTRAGERDRATIVPSITSPVSMLVYSHSLTRVESIRLIKSILQVKEEYLVRDDYTIKHHLNEVLQQLIDQEAEYMRITNYVKKIYKAWYDARYNPYTIIGRKRLLREFEEMIQ